MRPTALALMPEGDFKCCLSSCADADVLVADSLQLIRINVGDWFTISHQPGFEKLLHSV